MLAPVIRPTLPPGTVTLFYAANDDENGVIVPITSFFDANGIPKTKIRFKIPVEVVGPATTAKIRNKLAAISKARFNEIANKSDNKKLSVDSFVKKYPEFSTNIEDAAVSIQPNSAEQKGAEGLSKFIQRGGVLLSAKVFKDAIEPVVDRIRVMTCTKWCRGCITNYYPQGVPTCPLENRVTLKYEDGTDGDWKVYVRYGKNSLEVTAIMRRRGAVERFFDGTNAKLNNFNVWACKNIPTGLVVGSMLTSDPSLALANRFITHTMSQGCRAEDTSMTFEEPPPPPPAPPPAHQPPPPPPPVTPPAWYTTPGGKAAIAAGATGFAMLTAVLLLRR